MVQQIFPENVMEFISSRPCFVIDIREQEEFRKGHLPKAVQVEEDEIMAGEISFPKQMPLVVYCSEGSSSLKVARLLSMKGYYVFNLVGGYNAVMRARKKS